VAATKCHGRADCQGGRRCLTHTLWSDLSSRISSFLNDISLGELVRNNEISQISERQDIDINIDVNNGFAQKNTSTTTISAAPHGVNVRS
jgi:Rrf2 family iron-sulfur cluster assembly transcriptional regulator